jgi:preprotein translocase subunit SecE
LFCFLGEKLQNAMSYSVFVRIWYSSSQYAVFKSNGIVVMGQAPALTSKRGKTVCISVVGLWKIKCCKFTSIWPLREENCKYTSIWPLREENCKYTSIWPLREENCKYTSIWPLREETIIILLVDL